MTDQEKNIILWQNIQIRRKDLWLTQDEFARKVKIPYAVLTKLEIWGLKKPCVYDIAKIARYLKVAIEGLVG